MGGRDDRPPEEVQPGVQPYAPLTERSPEHAAVGAPHDLRRVEAGSASGVEPHPIGQPERRPAQQTHVVRHGVPFRRDGP